MHGTGTGMGTPTIFSSLDNKGEVLRHPDLFLLVLLQGPDQSALCMEQGQMALLLAIEQKGFTKSVVRNVCCQICYGRLGSFYTWS